MIERTPTARGQNWLKAPVSARPNQTGGMAAKSAEGAKQTTTPVHPFRRSGARYRPAINATLSKFLA